MLSLFTVPTAANVVSSSTEYASTLFTEFLPLLYVAVGITAAVVLILYIRKWITGGTRRAMGGGRRGGRRRR